MTILRSAWGRGVSYPRRGCPSPGCDGTPRASPSLHLSLSLFISVSISISTSISLFIYLSAPREQAWTILRPSSLAFRRSIRAGWLGSRIVLRGERADVRLGEGAVRRGLRRPAQPPGADFAGDTEVGRPSRRGTWIRKVTAGHRCRTRVGPVRLDRRAALRAPRARASSARPHDSAPSREMRSAAAASAARCGTGPSVARAGVRWVAVGGVGGIVRVLLAPAVLLTPLCQISLG